MDCFSRDLLAFCCLFGLVARHQPRENCTRDLKNLEPWNGYLGFACFWSWIFCGISTDAGSSSQPASIIPVGYTQLFFAIVSDVLIFSRSNRVRKLKRKCRFWLKKQRGWKIKIWGNGEAFTKFATQIREPKNCDGRNCDGGVRGIRSCVSFVSTRHVLFSSFQRRNRQVLTDYGRLCILRFDEERPASRWSRKQEDNRWLLQSV